MAAHTGVEGERVEQGEKVVDGMRSPHDILRLLGVSALANYIVNEVQEVYRLQGVKINDKHSRSSCARCCARRKSIRLATRIS